MIELQCQNSREGKINRNNDRNDRMVKKKRQRRREIDQTNKGRRMDIIL